MYYESEFLFGFPQVAVVVAAAVVTGDTVAVVAEAAVVEEVVDVVVARDGNLNLGSLKTFMFLCCRLYVSSHLYHTVSVFTVTFIHISSCRYSTPHYLPLAIFINFVSSYVHYIRILKC